MHATLPPAEPEALDYLPGDNGRRRLVAVEYMTVAPAHLRDGLHTEPPHAVPFCTLHAWVRKTNASGMFAGFNPSISR